MQEEPKGTFRTEKCNDVKNLPKNKQKYLNCWAQQKNGWVEGRINELEDSILEITQSEQTLESRLKNEISRDSLRYLREFDKRYKIFVLERKRERG